ncbi:MAG TPA: reverse transcriptase family protein [Methylomirabilota bacterium]|nr:reverse transcriptase family protein [Methylomirabilota bacterium]
MNHISGKGGQSEIPTLHCDGISYETATDKAEVFKKIFASKSNIDDKSKIPPLCSNLASSSLNNIKIRAKVVKSKLLHLKASKATGPDGISARVLRECASVFSKPLSSLFSLSLLHGVVPKEWKCANVIPIYKADGKSDPNNYRPISLLPIISKVMESIVNDHLCKHLFGLKLISNHQYGFRPKHSTLDLLTCATQNWERALDKGQEIKVVALDISRAFDSVWHNGLLSKLMSAGVGSHVYRWICDFLNDHSIRVTVNGRESSAASINAGVPQGSILGPTLFLIFINDLSQVISSSVSMFADDTTISAIVSNTKSRSKVADTLCNDT